MESKFVVLAEGFFLQCCGASISKYVQPIANNTGDHQLIKRFMSQCSVQQVSSSIFASTYLPHPHILLVIKGFLVSNKKQNYQNTKQKTELKCAHEEGVLKEARCVTWYIDQLNSIPLRMRTINLLGDCSTMLNNIKGNEIEPLKRGQRRVCGGGAFSCLEQSPTQSS
jgi:hypothetical protein